jgi:hypothetical protein
MRKLATFVLVATLATGIQVCRSVPAEAAPVVTMLMSSGAHHLIRVSKCEPYQNTTVVSGGYAPGFVPAYYPYPRNPYYWNDVYGYRYRQPQVVKSNPSLAIDYTNVGTKVASTIEFGLIARGALVAEVRDVGTFSPGAEIKHTFGISPNVFPIQTGLPQCVPLRITYKDGTHWKNPHLPAIQRSLYQ